MEGGPKETRGGAGATQGEESTPDKASNASARGKDFEKKWFTDEAEKLRQEAERLRVRAAALAEDARVREARAFAEKSSEEARKAAREATVTFDAVLRDASKAHSSLSARVRASAVETLADQSPETLALLARDRLNNAVRASSADIQKWQADVASSVEDRVFDELEVFVAELEPSLRESGRRATLGALGIARGKSPFIRSSEFDEARRAGDLEKTRRFELFEERLIQPVLAPFKKGMFEPVRERARLVALGAAGYSLACGALGYWLAKRSASGTDRDAGGGEAARRAKGDVLDEFESRVTRAGDSLVAGSQALPIRTRTPPCCASRASPRRSKTNRCASQTGCPPSVSRARRSSRPARGRWPPNRSRYSERRIRT